MPFCSSCGKEVVAGDKFCQACGTAPFSSPREVGKPDVVSILGLKYTRGTLTQFGSYKETPWFRRTWFLNLCILLLPLVPIVVPLFGDVYYKKGDGVFKYGKGSKFGLIWLGGAFTWMWIKGSFLNQ